MPVTQAHGVASIKPSCFFELQCCEPHGRTYGGDLDYAGHWELFGELIEQLQLLAIGEVLPELITTSSRYLVG